MCSDVVMQKEDVIIASLLLQCNSMSGVLFRDTNTMSWMEAWSSCDSSSNVVSSVRLSHITVASNGPDLGVG